MEVSLMEDDFNSEESLDLNDIFTDEFMSEYTDFESFGEFLAEAPVRIEDQDDFDNMDMSEMDAFVAEVTKFEAWEDMQGEAVSLYTINRSEEHTSELQSRGHLVCRLLLEKKNKKSIC